MSVGGSALSDVATEQLLENDNTFIIFAAQVI